MSTNTEQDGGGDLFSFRQNVGNVVLDSRPRLRTRLCELFNSKVCATVLVVALSVVALSGMVAALQASSGAVEHQAGVSDEDLMKATVDLLTNITGNPSTYYVPYSGCNHDKETDLHGWCASPCSDVLNDYDYELTCETDGTRRRLQ